MRLSPVSRPTAGYTLIEVVTVLVLVAIIASLAAPAMGMYVKRHKAQRALDSLAADLALARMLAVRNGGNAVVDFTGDDTYEIVVGGTTRKRVWLGQDFAGVSVTPPGDLTFNARGLLSTPSLSGGSGEIIVTLGETVRDVLTISATGRVYREF